MKKVIAVILPVILAITTAVFCFLFIDQRETAQSLEVQLTEIRAAADSLTERAASLEKHIAELEESTALLEEDLEGAMGENQSLTEEIESLKEEKALLDAEKAALESKLEGLEEELNSVTGGLSGSLDALQKKYDELVEKYKVLDLKTQLAAMIDTETVFDSHEDLEKVVYLTFDDGPSNNTTKILDILKEYGVQATFFVNSKGSKYNDTYIRIIEEGHVIGNHTAGHEYDDVYSSLSGFLSEIVTLQNKVYNLTGVYPQIFRYPGGSGNTVYKSRNKEIMTDSIATLKELGINYYDWNVDSRDASVYLLDADSIVKSATSNGSKTKVIILMHDAAHKTTTPEALPRIIEYYKEKGFEFRTLNNAVVPVQSRKS